MESAGGARVRVRILTEEREAEVIKLMTYGVIVRYYDGGIEFQEMLTDEDYEVIEDD